MLFLKEKQAKLILEIMKNPGIHLALLSRNINASYMFVQSLVEIMEKKGLVEVKRGRKRTRVTLTEKGKKVADNIYLILKELE